MKYDSALRSYPFKGVEEIEHAGIGIPGYNNQRTIEHVIQMVPLYMARVASFVNRTVAKKMKGGID